MILSFVPVPCSPQIHTDLLGIYLLGNEAFVLVGAAKAVATSNVNTPELDTLKLVSVTPLNWKVNGIVCTGVQVGVALVLRIVVQGAAAVLGSST